MRVAWDITTLCMPATGIGRYTREALYATARARPDWEFVATSFAGGEGTARMRTALGEMPTNIEHRHVKLPGARFVRRGISSAPLPALEAITGRVDAFVDSEWFHPRQRHGKRISVVYDLIPLRFPDWVDDKTRRFHLRTVEGLGERADTIVCISEATAGDVVRELGIPRERIAIVRPGVDPAYLSAVPDTLPMLANTDYLLAVGTINERKNLGVLIDAFAQIAGKYPAIRLVVCGAPDRDTERIAQLVRERGLERRVITLGYVADNELPGIVAAAKVFVFPSLFEGYGMPVVEAMAAGVPVLASNDPSIDEAAGGAAVRFDPSNPTELADALERLLGSNSTQQDLIRRGREHAVRCGWAASGEAFAVAIEQTLAGHRQKS
jgi:glycosyltransferase involved in cell wall biosynthesis